MSQNFEKVYFQNNYIQYLQNYSVHLLNLKMCKVRTAYFWMNPIPFGSHKTRHRRLSSLQTRTKPAHDHVINQNTSVPAPSGNNGPEQPFKLTFRENTKLSSALPEDPFNGRLMIQIMNYSLKFLLRSTQAQKPTVRWWLVKLLR